MATATAAPGLERLRDEIAALEKEIKALTDKREAEEKTLATLTAQSGTLSESIARGTAKASAAADLNQKLDGSKAALEGFDSLLREPTKRLEEKYGALRRLEAEMSQAAATGEVVQIAGDAEAILKRIAHVLQQAAGVDLQSYHQCRDKLDRIARRAQANVFPVPTAAQAAANERRRLDKLAMQQLGPILKLFGR
jgi:chromosome segregation ATPase